MFFPFRCCEYRESSRFHFGCATFVSLVVDIHILLLLLLVVLLLLLFRCFCCFISFNHFELISHIDILCVCDLRAQHIDSMTSVIQFGTPSCRCCRFCCSFIRRLSTILWKLYLKKIILNRWECSSIYVVYDVAMCVCVPVD